MASVATGVCEALILMSSINAGVCEGLIFKPATADNVIVSEIVLTRGVSNVGAGLRPLYDDLKLPTLKLDTADTGA
jgi:hypothetical protein